MRISKLLNPSTWLVGQLICLQAASAQTVTDKVETKLGGWTPSVQTSYLRSAAGQDSAYYQSVAAIEFNLVHMLLDSSSFLLSTGVSRDLDALEERNIWSATSLAYISSPYEVAKNLEFRYRGTVVAPTNSESRDYLSYRGSVGGSASLTRSWKRLPIGKSLAVGLSGNASRNFFEYDASENGTPNTTVALGTGVSAALEVTDSVQLSGSYGLKKSRKSNDTWLDTRYEHKLAAGYSVSNQLALSVSQGTENRAYSYDAQTAQFALYDFQTTIYELAATYTF
ncbi:MAG TPA: hypothetical protein VFO10_01085 [Oligoflexus sp.]|uniref:hypothetical protein n=1 Tax=Oligoflexus sp. TaxID=1971216 RepID=UPI002D7E6132|nr:hypothetical protein [Oligoflexus sp.]HET9235810.1 hypothetical protein [Oligoflexus sp.]